MRRRHGHIVFLLLLFVLIFNNFFVPCWKFGSPYLGNHSSRKSSATKFYQCVQYFRVYGCQCLGFLTWAQMLMHAIAHGGCMGTVTESALKVDSGIIIIIKYKIKKLAATGTRTRVSIAPGFSVRRSTN